MHYLVAMSRLRLTLAAAALALAAEVLAPIGSAVAAGRITTQTSAAVSKDNRLDFDYAFQVKKLNADVVDPLIRTKATAKRCEGCQSTALSYQVVLLQRPVDPLNVRPEVITDSINEECATCDTVVGAYQYIVGRNGPIHITDEGKAQLTTIKREVAALEKSGRRGPDMVAAADALGARVRDVLALHVVRTDGVAAEGKVEELKVKRTDGAAPESSTSEATLAP